MELAEARALFASGSGHLNAGRLDEAARDLRNAVRLFEISRDADPIELPAALNNLGTALATQNESVRAVPVLRRAHRLMDPKHHLGIASIAGNLARVLIELGDFAEASPLVDQALRSAEESRSSYQAYALAMRAQIRMERRDYDKALSDIERSFAFADSGLLAPNLHHIRGTILERSGRLADCIPEFEAAVQAARQLPQNTAGVHLERYFQDYVKALRRVGRKAEARRAERVARRLTPGS